MRSSNIQLYRLHFVQIACIWFQGRLYPILDEFVDLFWGSADESRGIQQIVQLTPYQLEVLVRLYTLYQIVLSSFLFDHCPCLVRQDSDLLVTLLSVSPSFDHGHDEVLGRHEGKLLAYPAGYDSGIDN